MKSSAESLEDWFMIERAKTKTAFTEGPLFFKVLLFALPIMATGILQILYNMADNIVVGKFSGDAYALAAVGCTSSLTSLIVNLLFGVASGTSVVVSQAYGAKDRDRVERAVHTSMTFALIGGIAFMILGLIVARPALNLMGTSELIIDSATLYLMIICCGIPASSVYNFGASILRAIGDSKTPLFILAASGLVNVVFNLIFVIGFGMTVDGVALATIISQYLSAASVVFILTRRRTESYGLSISKLRIHKATLLSILRFGLPSGIQGSLFSISNVILTSATNTFAPAIVSAKTIASNIDGLTYTAMNSFSHAAMTFVGQNYGAGKFDRVKRAFLCVFVQVVIVGVIVSQTEIFFGEPLAYMFVDKSSADAALIVGHVQEIFSVLLAFYFLCGMMEVLSGTVKAMGYSVTSMIISLFGACFFRIFWVEVLFRSTPEFSTLRSLFVVYPVSWSLTIIMQLILLLYAFRKLDKLKAKAELKQKSKEQSNI